MSEVSYRLHLGDEPASEKQLARIESVEVSQEMDTAWQALIRVPVCLDESGKWSDEAESFMTAFSRVRVEVDPGSGIYVPLIDGPVVTRRAARSNQPGESTVTLVVHDDSVYLDRNAEIFRHEQRSDSDIAADIFSNFNDVITSTDIDSVPNSSSGRPREEVQRETAMVYLRRLARRNQLHAYVLPGSQPGESIGVFKGLPTEADSTLPPLVVPGSDSNVEATDHEFNAQMPTRMVAFTLSLCDKSELSETGTIVDQRSFGDEDLLGSVGASTELLDPGTGESGDLRDRAQASAGSSRWASRLAGSVREGCYSAALEPYKAVQVRMGASSSSGNYVIRSVTHNLDRGSYRQSFQLITDGQSTVGSAGSLIPSGIV